GPGRAAVLPILEPELFRGAVHAGGIIRAGMADEALEAAGVSGDPINHEPAVGAAGGGEARAVNEGILLNRKVHALHQIKENLAAPVAADVGGERLSVAG